jgi:hypothetical protein
MMRGQISIELLLSVAIVLLLLTIFSLDSFSKNMQANLLRDDLSHSRECHRLAEVLARQSRTRFWSQVDINIDTPVTLHNNEIQFGNVFCMYFGIGLDSNLNAGTLRIRRDSNSMGAQNA